MFTKDLKAVYARAVVRKIKGVGRRVELYSEQLEAWLARLYKTGRRDLAVDAVLPDGRRMLISAIVVRLYGRYYIHPGYEHQRELLSLYDRLGGMQVRLLVVKAL